MNVTLPDPHPGRCLNYRMGVGSSGYPTSKRCLLYENTTHVCQFPDDPPRATLESMSYTGSGHTSVPWVSPLDESMTEEQDRNRKQYEQTSYILTRGKWDERIGRPAHWLIRRTWIRYTRFTAQGLVRVLLVPYMTLAVVQMIIYDHVPFHPNWFNTFLDVFFIVVILVLVQKISYTAEGLNSIHPDFRTVLSLRGVMVVRPLMFAIFAVALVTACTPMWFTVYHCVGVARAFILALAYYALTVGRPFPPAKKQRVPLRERIPQILPRLTPAGTRA